MRRSLHLLAGLALIVLAACAGGPLGGGGTPQTPAQRLVVAEASFAGVVEGLISARNAGLIERGSATEDSIGAGVLTARGALDAAHAAVLGPDPQAVMSWIAVAASAIAELQRALLAAQARAGQVSMIEATPMRAACTSPAPVARVHGRTLYANAGVAL